MIPKSTCKNQCLFFARFLSKRIAIVFERIILRNYNQSRFFKDKFAFSTSKIVCFLSWINIPTFTIWTTITTISNKMQKSIWDSRKIRFHLSFLNSISLKLSSQVSSLYYGDFLQYPRSLIVTSSAIPFYPYKS